MASPPQWDHIQHLYIEALNHSLDTRTAYLSEATKGDSGLLALLQSMLGAPTHPVLHGSAAEALSFDSALFESGESVDHYKIGERMAEGGMGVVFRAESVFARRPVAIKLIKPELVTEALISRFQKEQHILATLNHPGIVRLLDSGLHKGIPYIVMEFVDGLPITTYCNQNRLGLSGRFRLFELVCKAVEYAHQQFVIHRDIKPSNILVTRQQDGTPKIKLLDFGIAYLLEEQDQRTLTTERMLTPGYAAPEHINGQPITTATDVYGLGVVLYELLTGQLPIHTDGQHAMEAMQAILTEPPVLPCENIHLAQAERMGMKDIALIQASLSKKLGTVILKALNKDPQDRFHTINQLRNALRECIPFLL